MIICEIRQKTYKKPIETETFTSIIKAIGWMKAQEGIRADIIDTKKHKTVRKFGRGYGNDHNWYDLYTQQKVNLK